MSIVKDQVIFAQDVCKLVYKANDLGIYLTYGRAFDSPEFQDWLFHNGKSKTLDSMHLKRLAVDFNFFNLINGGTYQLLTEYKLLVPLGEFWESLDKKNRWGGNFCRWYPGSKFIDSGHFERHVA